MIECTFDGIADVVVGRAIAAWVGVAVTVVVVVVVVLSGATMGIAWPEVVVAVTGVRLRVTIGPWGLFGGSCDLAPNSTYCNQQWSYIRCEQS